jgi:hypothetical protein
VVWWYAGGPTYYTAEGNRCRLLALEVKEGEHFFSDKKEVRNLPPSRLSTRHDSFRITTVCACWALYVRSR